MSGSRRVLLVPALVAVLLVTAGPAFGCFPQSTAVTIPSLGEATVRSSTLPANATSATITAVPVSPADNTTFNTLTKTLSTLTARNARVLTCVFLYSRINEHHPVGEDLHLSEPSLQLLFSQMCLELAYKLPEQQHSSPVAHEASAACPRQNLAVAVRVSASGRKFHAHVKGTTHWAGGPSALEVTCRHVGTGIQISLRPHAAGKSLREIVGPRLGIGFLNPSTSHSVRVRTTFSIKLECTSS